MLGSQLVRREGLLLLRSDYGKLNVQKNGRDESVSSWCSFRGDAEGTTLLEDR